MRHITLLALVIGLSAGTAFAQDGPRGPGGPQGGGHPLIGPLTATLDKNTNNVIEATEIADASVSLKTLDANGDGQLSRDELMPKRPDGFGGLGGGLPPGGGPS